MHYVRRDKLKHDGVLPASYPQTRDEIPSLVVIGASSRSLHRRTHAVFVILANENAGQLPQRCHIIRLKDLTLQKQKSAEVYMKPSCTTTAMDPL